MQCKAMQCHLVYSENLRIVWHQRPCMLKQQMFQPDTDLCVPLQKCSCPDHPPRLNACDVLRAGMQRASLISLLFMIADWQYFDFFL